MRLWFSVPRLFNGLVRPGISLGREDFNPRLPSYRRYELRHGLQEAAKARGEPMSREDCDYAIDRARATGLLDSSGGLNFRATGYTPEEVAAQIIERSTAWGQPVSHDDAVAMGTRGIRRIWYENIAKCVLLLICTMIGIAFGLFWKGAFL